MSDPFENTALWLELFGEETVNQMTENTGDATNAVRDVFPRVTFRDVEDAEMVAESLRASCISMGKRAAQALKVWGLAAAANKISFVEVVVLDANGDPGNAYETVLELLKTENRMLGMLDATIAQLAQMYGTPTTENAKYVSDLLEFVTETTDFTDAVAMAAEELNKKSGEQ